MENKKDILESLFETLTRTRKWSDEIAEMLYHKDKNGNEEVLVRLYEGNAEMRRLRVSRAAHLSPSSHCLSGEHEKRHRT